MHQDLLNALCTRTTNVFCTIYVNVFCNEINGYELVNAHNYFIQIMHVIKWSSSLSMRCQNYVAQCRRPLVLCLHSHDIEVVNECFSLHEIRVCIGS